PRGAAPLRLRPARPEQPRRDGLLRAGPGRAVPGPKARRRLPSLCAPPPRGAGPRLRRGQGAGEPRPLHRRRLPSPGRLPGARRGRRQPQRARLLLRPGPGVRAARERLAGFRRLDDVPRQDASRGPHLPVSPRRAIPAGLSARARARGERALEPRPRAAAAALPDQEHHPGVPGPGGPVVRAAPGPGPEGGGGRAGQGPTRRLLQRRAPERPVARDRRSRRRGAGRRVGRVQARLRSVLLLARCALAAQPSEGGRAEPGRVEEPDHVRQPRPAGEAGRGPGLHQRRRRAPLSGRGETAPRGSAAMRGLAIVAVALSIASTAEAPSSTPLARPRLLIAERDPFSGLPILRASYAAGVRPPDDLAGWALSYVLTGDDTFAHRAL